MPGGIGVVVDVERSGINVKYCPFILLRCCS